LIEVMRLAAAELSNRAIAARLVVTERTVATHVGHTLGELGLGSRAQAGIRAAERGSGPGAAEAAAPDAP
jgi:DNA-binding NarL/FixJ family response regulator